jgi:hypothetical protein
MVNAGRSRLSVARREQALRVEIPTSDADRLRLGRVGLLALGGFVLGIAWPRLAGVAQAQAAAEPATDDSAAVPPQAAPPLAPGAPPTAKTAAVEVLTVNVGNATITSCRHASGRRSEQCGAIDLDSVIRGPLQALASCRAAGGARGTLSLGFDVDFEAKRIMELKSGKSTTLGNQTAGALAACAKHQLASVALDAVQHEHPRYTVYYSIEIAPNEGASAESEPSPASSAEGDIVAASGRATVSWGVALIRAEPKEGDVVARVLSGTRVVVTGRKGDWYRVKYDAKGNEGWVYRTAIGL